MTKSRSVVVWGQDGRCGEKGISFGVMEMSSVVIVMGATWKIICQVHQTVYLIICKLYFSNTDLQARMWCDLEPRYELTRILK